MPRPGVDITVRKHAAHTEVPTLFGIGEKWLFDGSSGGVRQFGVGCSVTTFTETPPPISDPYGIGGVKCFTVNDAAHVAGNSERAQVINTGSAGPSPSGPVGNTPGASLCWKNACMFGSDYAPQNDPFTPMFNPGAYNFHSNGAAASGIGSGVDYTSGKVYIGIWSDPDPFRYYLTPFSYTVLKSIWTEYMHRITWGRSGSFYVPSYELWIYRHGIETGDTNNLANWLCLIGTGGVAEKFNSVGVSQGFPAVPDTGNNMASGETGQFLQNENYRRPNLGGPDTTLWFTGWIRATTLNGLYVPQASAESFGYASGASSAFFPVDTGGGGSKIGNRMPAAPHAGWVSHISFRRLPGSVAGTVMGMLSVYASQADPTTAARIARSFAFFRDGLDAAETILIPLCTPIYVNAGDRPWVTWSQQGGTDHAKFAFDDGVGTDFYSSNDGFPNGIGGSTDPAGANTTGDTTRTWWGELVFMQN
jgi:hypothetical protein